MDRYEAIKQDYRGNYWAQIKKRRILNNTLQLYYNWVALRKGRFGGKAIVSFLLSFPIRGNKYQMGGLEDWAG